MISRIIERIKDGLWKYLVTAGVVTLLAVIVVFIRSAMAAKTYSSYRVEKEAAKTAGLNDSVTVTKYEYADGFVLAYSRDGSSLINKNLEKIWSVSYSMNDPVVDVCGGQILIYDCMGTLLYLCNEKGVVSSITTDRPIVKACVSAKATCAVLLSDEERVNLVYYAKDGSRIAAGESTMRNPGYPADLSLSEDGTLLAVTYLSVADGTTSSIVRFYNFGSGGHGKTDNMTGEFRYPGVFAPQVQYLSGSKCVIFKDDGFVIVKGRNEQKEVASESFGTEITSTFCEGNVIGIVTISDVRDHRYSMSIYGADGTKKSSCPVDLSYERVRAAGGQVIFSGRTEFAVYSTGGRCRFAGKLNEGNITDTIRIGRNRFLILTDNKMEVISLQ